MNKALPTLADFRDWPNRRLRAIRLAFEAVQPFRIEVDSDECVVFALGLSEYGMILHGLAVPLNPTADSAGRMCFLFTDLRGQNDWKDEGPRIDHTDWQWRWLERNGVALYQMMLNAFAFVIETTRPERTEEPIPA